MPERPHKHKQTSPAFEAFEDALAWTEQRLLEVVAEAANPSPVPEWPEPLSLATLSPDHRARLAPFWIEPSVLTRGRITYRAIIEVEHRAIAHDFMELSFGERKSYDTRWPTATQIAQKLHLDANQLDVQEICPGYYRVTSLVTNADQMMAQARGEKVWERSMIVSVFRAGQIVWADYGVEEVETEYKLWVGGCGDWPVER